MKQKLVWLDKNWRRKGCADNLYLIVDYQTKMYNIFASYVNPTGIHILASRQSDLYDYEETLRRNGFIKNKDVSA